VLAEQTVIGMGVQKTENQVGLCFKNRTVQKFEIHPDGFPTETACNPQFK